jgi:hypothetical protein
LEIRLGLAEPGQSRAAPSAARNRQLRFHGYRRTAPPYRRKIAAAPRRKPSTCRRSGITGQINLLAEQSTLTSDMSSNMMRAAAELA